MKWHMHDITEFLDRFVPLKYMINGLIGGFIWSLYRKSKFVEALRQIFIGGIVSAYTTPVIIDKTAMTMNYVGFTSFVIGMLGMVIVDSITKYCISKIKKWSDAIVLISKTK